MTPVEILSALEGEMMAQNTSKTGKEYIREIVKNALGNAYKKAKEPKRRLPGPSAVIDTVCKIASLEPEDLKSRSRKLEVTAARHLAMYLLSPKYGPSALGRMFKRDHTSVRHAVKTAYESIHQDTVIAQYYSQYLTITG